MKENKTKVITIAALVIAVIALSIGFAAFASTLNIQTGASVTPNDTFVVKFSNSNSELLETNVTASDGSQYGGSATIDNRDVKNPKIDNLSASFTAPGQSVTYTFYVRNMGDYDAYLTDVRFNNATGKQVFKSCTSSGSNPGTQSIVDDVCDDITFTLELEDTPNKVLTSTSDFAIVVGNNYILNRSPTPNTGTTNSKMVKVTIAYPNKDGVHYADGSFTVNFGSVEMIFATLAGYIPPTPTPATSEQMAVDNLIPTEVQKSAAILDTSQGFNEYSYLNGIIKFQEMGGMAYLVLNYGGYELEWACNEGMAQALGYEVNKWYDSETHMIYEGPNPLSSISLEGLSADALAYVTRVINSFGN